MRMQWHFIWDNTAQVSPRPHSYNMVTPRCIYYACRCPSLMVTPRRIWYACWRPRYNTFMCSIPGPLSHSYSVIRILPLLSSIILHHRHILSFIILHYRILHHSFANLHTSIFHFSFLSFILASHFANERDDVGSLILPVEDHAHSMAEHLLTTLTRRHGFIRQASEKTHPSFHSCINLTLEQNPPWFSFLDNHTQYNSHTVSSLEQNPSKFSILARYPHSA